MVEAQLNIYHHFLLSNSGMGDQTSWRCMCCTDRTPAGHMTLGPIPTTSLCSLGVRAHCPREKSWGGHMEGREGAGAGNGVQAPLLHHIVTISLPSPPHLQNRGGLVRAQDQEWTV